MFTCASESSDRVPNAVRFHAETGCNKRYLNNQTLPEWAPNAGATHTHPIPWCSEGRYTYMDHARPCCKHPLHQWVVKSGLIEGCSTCGWIFSWLYDAILHHHQCIMHTKWYGIFFFRRVKTRFPNDGRTFQYVPLGGCKRNPQNHTLNIKTRCYPFQTLFPVYESCRQFSGSCWPYICERESFHL